MVKADFEETTWTFGSWSDDPISAGYPDDPVEDLTSEALTWRLVAAGIVQVFNDRRPGYQRYHVWAERP